MDAPTTQRTHEKKRTGLKQGTEIKAVISLVRFQGQYGCGCVWSVCLRCVRGGDRNHTSGCKSGALGQPKRRQGRSLATVRSLTFYAKQSQAIRPAGWHRQTQKLKGRLSRDF
jgi:hypothetical protein